MDKQTKDARQMVKNMPMREKLAHFWYYHKAHTIVAVIVALVIGTIVYQTLTREKYDLEISYYGTLPLGEAETVKIEEYLEEYIEDTDGNGEKNVKIYSTAVGLNPENGNTVNFDQKLIAELTAAVYPAYIFDEGFLQKAGPDLEGSVMECAINLRANPKLDEMLNLGEEPVYWCTRMLYERESGKEKSVKAYNNAKIAEKAIKGE